MCGITGWVDSSYTKDHDSQSILEEMLLPLRSRGIDDKQTWSDDAAFFGHTRLKIIDLDGGSQPMVSPLSVLTYNGEIYNYEELKKELISKGEQFHSTSDTEVLQKSLEVWGIEALKKVRGMYAFSFYNRHTKSLLLARDPLGKKPLFFSHQKDKLIFSSTCQSLRKHPNISREISTTALAHYLIGESPKDPQTLYRDIQAVPSGGWVLFKNHTLTQGSHWDWPTDSITLSPEEERETFQNLFEASVKRRLRSDVPLGVLLSGGLDSSSVAWQASQLSGSQPIQTFSIGFQESSYDETSYSQLFSNTLGSTHHNEILSESNLLDILPQSIESLDQPLSDSSLLPFYLLCQLTKKHVTVALSGDGADDIMAGYDPFKAVRWLRYSKGIPRVFLKRLSKFFKSAAPRDHNLPWTFKGKQFLRGLNHTGGLAAAHWMSAWDPQSIKYLFSQSSPNIKIWEREYPNDLKDCLAYFRTRYLRDQILVKVDRASMAHSLEIRSPFLDQDLVEFLSKIPIHRLYSNGVGKKPLRTWAQDKLPQLILDRPKKGFGMPISQWMRGPLSSWVTDLVNETTLKDIGLSPDKIIRLRDRHLNGSEDHRKELWTLAVLCAWWLKR